MASAAGLGISVASVGRVLGATVLQLPQQPPPPEEGATEGGSGGGRRASVASVVGTGPSAGVVATAEATVAGLRLIPFDDDVEGLPEPVGVVSVAARCMVGTVGGSASSSSATGGGGGEAKGRRANQAAASFFGDSRAGRLAAAAAQAAAVLCGAAEGRAWEHAAAAGAWTAAAGLPGDHALIIEAQVRWMMGKGEGAVYRFFRYYYHRSRAGSAGGGGVCAATLQGTAALARAPGGRGGRGSGRRGGGG